MSEFTATLPDGSPMEIEVLDNENGVWAGEFAVAAETGPYAHQIGSFEGRISGNTLTATCELADGSEFTMTGTADGNKSLKLTRSDIPGTVLNFVPVMPLEAAVTSRADVSFMLTTGGTNGRIVISNSPYSVQAGGTMTEYRGAWQGMAVTFWSYSSGYASCVIYVDPMCIITANFNSLKLSDFSTANQTGSGLMTMYSSVVRAQVKVKFTPIATP
ncbi:hypothetical protein [Fimbriimonas ginsengisoli]|uniref:Uncharacterized protein n=1 Tax=Fimbriimonas ginsengisoli Gsoil 348 TaxID=661478 RepID=A0A068NT40_FIMGI|nr:hypothetical protein [Fimbriimonas ginsengisoli]AIE86512.1 hypothetical protein OP10G_3144 [Fimbriimonas ginsengisoli Gsoil 348]